MEEINNVIYRLTKSKDPKFCEVVAKFKYKGKRREYYLFVKKNPRYKPSDYLKAAQKQFAIDVKKGRVADAFMNKKPFAVLGTIFAATAIVFGVLITKKYLAKPDGIVFDAGDDATIELYKENKVSFPIKANGVTWDNFYKEHHYLGAVKSGYDFLYWSLDGKNPIDNNYVFTEPTKLIPVYHENTDGVSFILRHIPNQAATEPQQKYAFSYFIDDESYPGNKIKARKNYGAWQDYEEGSEMEVNKVGDTVSFKTTDSYSLNHFDDSADGTSLIFAISGDAKNLVGNNMYKEKAFFRAFESIESDVYSAGGLIFSGDEYPDDCLNQAFWGLQLVIPPQLPANKVGKNCCTGMFESCSKMILPPELPATILSDHCYDSMFQFNESLIQAPDLPATILADACYYNMFDTCTHLIAMPALPATTTAYRCYFSMFSWCDSLRIVTDLPATNHYDNGELKPGLAGEAYYAMFNECTSLQESPHIYAKVVDDTYEFREMFSGCSSLTSIKIDFKGNFYDHLDTFHEWVNGVAEKGTFYYNGTDDTRDISAIPEGWTVKKF